MVEVFDHASTRDENPNESESELIYDRPFTANHFVLEASLLKPTTSISTFQVNTFGYNPYLKSSLTKGLVCRLQLLLGLASTIILGSESRWTYDHILLSQIRDSPTLKGQVPVLTSPGTGWPCYTPRRNGRLPPRTVCVLFGFPLPRNVC
jgi:hypothetical protein